MQGVTLFGDLGRYDGLVKVVQMVEHWKAGRRLEEVENDRRSLEAEGEDPGVISQRF